MRSRCRLLSPMDDTLRMSVNTGMSFSGRSLATTSDDTSCSSGELSEGLRTELAAYFSPWGTPPKPYTA